MALRAHAGARIRPSRRFASHFVRPSRAAHAARRIQEYRDATYHLSLFYPGELSARTYDEVDGAATIDFQSVEKGEGFQIFIVPYSGTTVSAQRFKQDEPSGVRNNPTYGLVDGASVSSFYSTDASLGDTYEVWFIHGGYLYEVTTLKPLDAWLQNIMQTWLFI